MVAFNFMINGQSLKTLLATTALLENVIHPDAPVKDILENHFSVGTDRSKFTSRYKIDPRKHYRIHEIIHTSVAMKGEMVFCKKCP